MLQLFLINSLLFFSFLVPIQTTNSSNYSFPKKLWVSWNSDLSYAPTFTRLCINNMQHYTKISGWQLTLFNNDNVYNYLGQQSINQLKFIRSQLTNPSPQTLADLHRIFVVYQNGGMWLDANSFFVRDLSWVNNIHEQPSVYNKVVEEPEIIMFTFNWLFGENKTIIYDGKSEVKVRLFPGTENWSFFAKPKARLLKDFIERTIYTYKKSNLTEYFEQNKRLGYIYRQQIDPYFLLSNYQLQTLFQSKQREIESNQSKFEVKSAVEYYKMWNVDALQTAYLLYEVNQWEIQSSMKTLFYKPISDFTDKYNKKINFIKLSSSYYPFANAILSKSLKAICLHTIQPFPQSSVISQFLFKYSPNQPLIQRHIQLREQLTNKQAIQCQDIVEEIRQGIISLAIKVGLVLIGINLVIFWFIKSIHYCVSWAGKCFKLAQNNRNDFDRLGQSEPLQFPNKLGQQ